MSIKKLRNEKNLSQEMLAETVGLSLRTIQRAESGDNVATSSWNALADYFGVDARALKTEPLDTQEPKKRNNQTHNLAEHRAIQLIIFGVTFFVCVSQWGAYYAFFNPQPDDVSLSTILLYLSEIALGAAIFICLFNHAKVIFVWSYYLVTAAFIACAISIAAWAEPYAGTASHALLFPAFYTLMLSALLIFHVLQTALSLKGEEFEFPQRSLVFMSKAKTS